MKQPRNVGRGTLEKRVPLPQIYERGAHLSLSKDFWAYPISLHSPFRHRLPWEESTFQSGNTRLRPHVQPLSEAVDFAMQHALHAGVQEIHALSPVVFKPIRAGEKCRTPHPRHENGRFTIR